MTTDRMSMIAIRKTMISNINRNRINFHQIENGFEQYHIKYNIINILSYLLYNQVIITFY